MPFPREKKEKNGRVDYHPTVTHTHNFWTWHSPACCLHVCAMVTQNSSHPHPNPTCHTHCWRANDDGKEGRKRRKACLGSCSLSTFFGGLYMYIYNILFFISLCMCGGLIVFDDLALFAPYYHLPPPYLPPTITLVIARILTIPYIWVISLHGHFCVSV